MSIFIINRKQNRVYIASLFESMYDLGTIDCSIGNIIDVLEKEFPANSYADKSYSTNLIRNKIAGKMVSKSMWGFKDDGVTIHAIHLLLSGRDKIELKNDEIENFRITYGLSIKHTYLNHCDINEGIQVKNATSILDIVFHLLYYYTLNNLKLVKCEHCGRWFATSTLKTKYCPRNSPIKGYTHLNCEQAVRNIKQQCSRKKNRIETKANNANKGNVLNHSYSSFIVDFQKQCDCYIERLSKRLSVNNLSDYLHFLDRVEKAKEWLTYSDSK